VTRGLSPKALRWPLFPVLAETAAWLVDRVIPRVPVRHWVLSFPIPLRGLFAVHPETARPGITDHSPGHCDASDQAGGKRSEVGIGAVTLIQRFGSAANHRCDRRAGADRAPTHAGLALRPFSGAGTGRFG
jgi:hypothetical protein